MRSNSRPLLIARLANQWRDLLRALLGEVGWAYRMLAWWPALALLIAMPLALTAAWQLPQSFSVDVGSPQDQAYVLNFHDRLEEAGRTYRWSDAYGYVNFPGLGALRPFTVTVEVDAARSADVTLIVNGVQRASRRLEPGWQTLVVPVTWAEPAALQSRDTVVEIRAPAFTTQDAPSEAKGLKVDRVTVDQDRMGGFIFPALAPLVSLTTAVALAYLLVALSLARFATQARVRLLGLLAALGVALPALAWVVIERVPAATAAPHFGVTLLSGVALLIASDLALRGRLPAGSARGLAVVVTVAFVVRYGGMALPQSVIIDMPWHMKWQRTLLSGDWQALYFPGGLSAVPREWGVELLIPKSPLFYFAFAPLAAMPFDIETSAKWLISLLDASNCFLAYWLGKQVSGVHSPGLFAAVLYAAMPLAFRAFAYGILPTIFAQWLAALLFFAILRLRYARWSAFEWLLLLTLCAVTLLAFPTVALFVTLVLLAVALLWTKARQDWTGGWRSTLRLPVLLVAGWIVATVAYYGLYIQPALASATALLATQGGNATVRWPEGPGQLLAWTGDYVVSALPALLALLGLALLWRGRLRGSRATTLDLLAVWLAVAPLFMLANYRLDMIGKHLYFVMLPVAALGGVALGKLSVRSRGGALSVLLLGVVIVEALAFWVERLVRAST